MTSLTAPTSDAPDRPPTINWWIKGRMRSFTYSHNVGDVKIYSGTDDDGNPITLRVKPRWAPAGGFPPL